MLFYHTNLEVLAYNPLSCIVIDSILYFKLIMDVDVEITGPSSDRFFSEGDLALLFTTRDRALASTDTEERDTLMQEADTERERLLASLSLSPEQRRQLNDNLAYIYRQFTTKTIPQIVAGDVDRFRTLPPATPAANPQDLVALQAQLEDLPLKYLVDDHQGRATLNREEYVKAARKLFVSAAKRIIPDQSVAWAQGLQPKREPRTTSRHTSQPIGGTSQKAIGS